MKTVRATKKTIKTTKKLATEIVGITSLALSFSAPLFSAVAQAAMPDESGFSGFIGAGGSAVRLKSNMIAGSSGSRIGKEIIESLTHSPDSRTKGTAYINGELVYTWAESKIQLFLGNALEDWVRYDFASELGIRKEFMGVGEFSAAFLFSPWPTKVWKDPYLLNSRRRETNRTDAGGVFSWKDIMESGVEVKLGQQNPYRQGGERFWSGACANTAGAEKPLPQG